MVKNFIRRRGAPMRKMYDMTIKEFAEEVASNSPAPGGGSVAALCGSISSALSSMVLSLTVGKKRYLNYSKENRDSIDNGIAKANDLKGRFLELMVEDTVAFDKVMAAFKLPRETDEEKAIRSRAVAEAYVDAMKVPLNVAKLAMEVFPLLKLAAAKGTPSAITDAGVGALVACSCVEGAILNVRINLSGINDEKLAEETRNQCRTLVEAARIKRDEILEIVEAAL